MLGIDVSHYQNDAGPINWTNVYSSGIRFVIIKATEAYDIADGSSQAGVSVFIRGMKNGLTPQFSTNPLSVSSDHFVENITGATNANILASAYHLTRPDRPKYPSDLDQSSIYEAQYFLSRANNYITAPYLPPVIDVEILGGLSALQLSRWIRTWIQYVQQQKPGLIPIIYTTRSILITLDNDLVTNYRLWIATDDGDISGTPSYQGTSWPNWKFKQYRFGESGGLVTGVTGPVDLDSFNGNMNALNGIVPVELTSFTINGDNGNFKLNWKTVTELNNLGFDVERSINMFDWLKLGFVKGNGNSTVPINYSYVDKSVSMAGKYYYRLKQIDNIGTYKYSDIVEADLSAPSILELNQNYPNPFNPSTTISYSLPKTEMVSIKIYDMLGKEVRTLVNEYKNAGSYMVVFNASNLASGTYLYRLTTGEFTQVKKLILLK